LLPNFISFLKFFKLYLKLDGESDSDTEFEDELEPQMINTIKEVLCSSKVEEIRLNLEKSLGEKKFIDAYPQIEKLILNEVKEKSTNSSTKKSLNLFKELFPTSKNDLYDQFYKLILADNEISF